MVPLVSTMKCVQTPGSSWSSGSRTSRANVPNALWKSRPESNPLLHERRLEAADEALEDAIAVGHSQPESGDREGRAGVPFDTRLGGRVTRKLDHERGRARHRPVLPRRRGARVADARRRADGIAGEARVTACDA